MCLLLCGFINAAGAPPLLSLRLTLQFGIEDDRSYIEWVLFKMRVTELVRRLVGTIRRTTPYYLHWKMGNRSGPSAFYRVGMM